MKWMKWMAVALAAGMLVTSLVACSDDSAAVETEIAASESAAVETESDVSAQTEADAAESTVLETETVEAGTYEGYGFQVSYDATFWTNMYNNTSTSDAGVDTFSLMMYNSEFSTSVEILRADGSLSTLDECLTFFANQAASQELNGHIVSGYTEEVTDASVTVSFFVGVPSYVYDDDGNVLEEDVTEFYLRYDALIDGDESIVISIAALKDDYLSHEAQFSQLVETVVFSDEWTAGAIYNEEDQYYNYAPETTPVDGYVYLNQTVYQDDAGGDRVAYTVNDGLDDDFYTYKESLQFDSYGIYGYIYTNTGVSEDADPSAYIYESVESWYTQITSADSTYFVSDVTMSPETITTNDDGVAIYVMAYAPMQSVTTIDANGDEVYEYEDIASNVFVNIFLVQVVDDALEYSSYEITRSKLTDESFAVIDELCDALGVSYADIEHALTDTYGSAA